MEWIWVRHGETEWTREHRYCGVSDVPLSEQGASQAKSLSQACQMWRPTHIFVSPLTRTQQTLHYMLENADCTVPIRVDVRLREVDFGVWEGKTVSEIEQMDGATYKAWRRDPKDVIPGGGEPLNEVTERLQDFWEEVQSTLPSDATVLIVSHRTVLRIWGALWLGIPLENYRARLSFDPAHSSAFRGDPGNPLLMWWNQGVHP